MKVTLKHTTDVTTEYFSPNEFGEIYKDYKARKFNIDRLKSISELTNDSIKQLSNVVMIKEGEGDAWTAININDIVNSSSNSTWLSVQMTIVQCANDVVNKLLKD